MDHRQQLTNLLAALKSLGQEIPQCLVSLTQIVQPTLPQEVRIPLLAQMFHEVPSMLQNLAPQALYDNIVKPPHDAVAWRLLLELRTLQQILSGVSYLQLLHLTNNMIPPGTAQQQLQFLRQIQELFQTWSNAKLVEYNKRLTATPQHSERQLLLSLEPRIPADTIALVTVMLKLPSDELLSFKQWIESLHHTHLIYLVNLLQMESQVLLEIKRRISSQPTPTLSSGFGSEQTTTQLSSSPLETSSQYAHTIGPHGIDETNSGTSRFGKRDRSGTAKEIVNIRSSGILDTSLGPMGFIPEDESDMPSSKVRHLMNSSGGGGFMNLDSSYGIPHDPMLVSQNEMLEAPIAMDFEGDDQDEDMTDFTFPDALSTSWSFPVSRPLGESTVLPLPDNMDKHDLHSMPSNLMSSTVLMQGLGASQMFEPSHHQSAVVEIKPLNMPPAPAPTPVPIPVSPNPSPLAAATSIPIPAPAPMTAPALSLQPQLQLRIAKQPPAKTVYQRILKPFPAVMLVGAAPPESAATLFVEATLLRSDSDTELPQILDGNKTIRISTGVFATFKRLKILSTSQQQGTLFRLRFTLKRYVGTVFEVLHSAVALSNPIEVFSHTQYLTNKKGNAPPTPATVLEILPHQGHIAGGSRVAVLGANFVHTPQLRVKFGDQIVQCQFHESGTLVCLVPPSPIARTVEVRVSNDGTEFSGTCARFTYLG